MKPYAPRTLSRPGIRQFQGPSVQTVPASPTAVITTKTVFRAFTGQISAKGQDQPLKTLGFGLFNEAGQMQEKYAEASGPFWLAILATLGVPLTDELLPLIGSTQALLQPVTGGVVPIIAQTQKDSTGKEVAGMWRMAMIPNAQLAVLQLPEVQTAIIVWVQCGLWACTATVNDKQFSIPEVAAPGSALFTTNPMLLLGNM